ncbi:DUF4347 domain-containing protein, partial [Microcoleus sp. F4-D5]|uniref:DUF4347 domain-containing protein n=1 Tax=Microcoleus sp. F4-D5 TaxID=2818760 RepID=UPI002FD06BDB
MVVDSRVQNYEQLIGGLKAGTEVFVLNSTQDAIEQITEILGQRNIKSLHVVSHGREAAVEIGSTELNIDNLETYSSHLQQWRKALSEEGNILLYGCNVAAGESGIKFIQKLSELTGANIAASNNLTGSAALGGDWELEIATRRINTELAFKKEVLEAYTSVLATLVSETFQGSTALGPWIYGTSGTSETPGLTAGTGPGIIPGVVGGPVDPPGSGALRLTSANVNQSAFVIYNSPISSTDGLKVTFDLFAYNGSTGADGVSFFLIDGTTTPTAAGGFGGSLGYAPNDTSSTPGIAGGYLGVGLDEFGNFSTSNEGREGGTGQLADSIAIRGSAATTYSFLTNATVPSGIDNVAATTRTAANVKKTVQITLLPGSNSLSVALDDNGNGVFDTNETLIEIADLVAVNGTIPPTFKFGFASSTGSFTNFHEIANLAVETINTPALSADISVAKTGPVFATPGSTLTYTITSTNNGTSSATDVLIQDQLPANLTFFSADNGGVYDPTRGTVTWPTIPTLANTASAIRSITATVPAATPIGTTITNTAFSNSSTFDPNPANNNGSLSISQAPTTIVATTADLVTTKTGSTSAAAGSIVSYTISTVNNGPSTATNVTVSDTIVPGLTGVTVSDGGTYNSATGIVTFPAVSLTNTASVTNTVSFIAPASGPSVSNTASSSSDTPDPTPGNNSAAVTTTVTPSADLVTTKTGSTSAAAGSIVSYTISTVNNGPSTATNVTVSDTIVPGLTGVTVSDGGTYNSATGIVTFPAVSLTNTASVTNTVSFIAPASGPSVSNTASSSSATPDPTPGNNNGTDPLATATTTLTPTPTPNQPPLANNANSSLGPNSSQLITGLG